ncbi:MAG: oxidoreductase, partial [Bacteroidia bacterium]|nr:oxidoreductase [Bacteroidia bacterium]
IRETKARLGQNFTYANFHLLGDPALTLHYPQYQILTSAVNGKTLSVSSRDTLGALQKVSISGKIVNTEGTILNQYNGLVYTTVFDREKKINCLVNTPESALYVDTLGSFMPFSFVSQKNVLYRGKAQVKNGLFSFNFIVPKDIAIDAGPGKISYYATDGISDASGSEQRLMVGGKPVANLNDNTGPRLQLFMNDINFVNGGITHSNPILGVLLEDSSGINTSGNGIGHDIVAILDYEKNKPLVLNDYYEADVDRYQSGQIRYPLTNLKEGSHHISIKAWDIQNNSSEAELDFIVAQNSVLALKHVLNYPNPFTNQTQFYFEHNQVCNQLEVQIHVLTISGRLVKTLREDVSLQGFRSEGISWDGRDEFG